MILFKLLPAIAFAVSVHCVAAAPAGAAVNGWLCWRGPNQNGTSQETGLPDKVAVDGENFLWTFDAHGRGTPVIAGERVYVFGYRGEKTELREILACLDAKTGKPHWELQFSDFISDAIYNRYSIGSPAVDPATGKIYLVTTPGLFSCFDPDGKMLWQHSLMEEYGRLTFPNSRTGSPLVEGELVIIRCVTSNWGADGPARDRFYAFDKTSGELVWACTPGVGPKDNSFSLPALEWRDGKRLLYAGTGCGNVVCVNARSGEALWRFQLSQGGINSSVVLADDRLVVIHGTDNVDNSSIGRMIALKLGAQPDAGQPGPKVLDQSAELWRNHLGAFSSSPVLADGRIYQVEDNGLLQCVELSNGKINWKLKLGTSQIHASPLYADGKLYVPMNEGLFYIIRPAADKGEILCQIKLEGNCLGAPAVWDGRIYVHTTEKLYCFGVNTGGKNLPQAWPDSDAGKPEAMGAAAKLQIVPAEILLRPGEKQSFALYPIDTAGLRADAVKGASWESFIPPTARVKARMDAEIQPNDTLAAGANARISAGAFKATADGLSGTIRGRVLPRLPYSEDFEAFEIAEKHATEADTLFAYPPLPWIGGRFKWEIREVDGTKALAKTLDVILFQRAMTFIGHPDESNYTLEADVMSDGNRRILSDVGVINQRYNINLKGNWQQLEVVSNYERFVHTVPFKWKAKTWYRLKTRVDVAEDGSGVVRAKAWPRGEAEPENWLIEVPHQHAHTHGAPGLYGFALQSQFRVYVDNIAITPNR